MYDTTFALKCQVIFLKYFDFALITYRRRHIKHHSKLFRYFILFIELEIHAVAASEVELYISVIRYAVIGV